MAAPRTGSALPRGTFHRNNTTHSSHRDTCGDMAHGAHRPTHKELIGRAGRANVSSKLMDAATLSSTVASAPVTAAEIAAV